MKNKTFIVLVITGIIACSAACQGSPSIDALAGNAIGYKYLVTELKEYPPIAANHKITITRNAKTKAERKALRIAEDTFTPSAILMPLPPQGQTQAPPKPNEIWWYTELDDTKLPCTITKEVIDYYTALVTRYQTKPLKSITEPRTDFSYEANVKAHNEEFLGRDGQKYSRVWVVDMKLNYFHIGGEQDSQNLIISFRKEKQVILDYKFKVLSVYGDGPVMMNPL